MRNFFYKVTGALSRFMYGRNGTDQLNLALLVLYVAICVPRAVTLALTNSALVRLFWDTLLLAMGVVLFFRMFSRNLPKRQAENQRFLAWWYPIKNRVSGAKQRRLDKEHKYFTCQNCKTICRVPAGKGKIEITCPKCGCKIIGRS